MYARNDDQGGDARRVMELLKTGATLTLRGDNGPGPSHAVPLQLAAGDARTAELLWDFVDAAHRNQLTVTIVDETGATVARVDDVRTGEVRCEITFPDGGVVGVVVDR